MAGVIARWANGGLTVDWSVGLIQWSAGDLMPRSGCTYSCSRLPNKRMRLDFHTVLSARYCCMFAGKAASCDWMAGLCPLVQLLLTLILGQRAVAAALD